MLLGLALTRSHGKRAYRRRAASVVAYTVALGSAAGLSQRDAWPFSRWNFAGALAAPTVTTVRLVGLDASGREHAIDPRAFEPLPFDELRAWILTRFPNLPEPSRSQAASYLLDRAEQARARARAGAGIGASRRWLGPLAAPSFVLHPSSWTTPQATPDQPFRGLRIYRESWDQERRAREGAAAVGRSLEYELRRP